MRKGGLVNYIKNHHIIMHYFHPSNSVYNPAHMTQSGIPQRLHQIIFDNISYRNANAKPKERNILPKISNTKFFCILPSEYMT